MSHVVCDMYLFGIKNDNSAVVWGRGTHGYNEFNTDYNTVKDVKDVYFNGDKQGGSILLVKIMKKKYLKLK